MVNKEIKALLIEDSLDVARLIREELKDIPYSNIDMEMADHLKDGIDIIKRGNIDAMERLTEDSADPVFSDNGTSKSLANDGDDW